MILVSAILTAALVAACGSGSSATGNPSAGNWQLAGKKVGIICSLCAVEGARIPNDQLIEAAKTLGWQYTAIDGQYDQKKWIAAGQQFINASYDGIVESWISAGQLGPVVQDAAKAKVPLASLLGGPADVPNWHDTHPNPNEVAKLQADWVQGITGGTGKLWALIDAANDQAEQTWKAFQSELSSRMPGIQVVGTHQTDLANMANDIPAALNSALQSNPGINVIWSESDSQSTFMYPVLAKAGRNDVALVTSNGDSTAFNAIKQGLKVGTVAFGMGEGAYQTMDVLMAQMAGRKLPVYDQPVKLIDKTNVPASGLWLGNDGYVQRFKTMWQSEYGLPQ